MSRDNGLQYRLTEVKNTVQKWLTLEHPEIIDVILATYVANRLEADPVWMILIGPPSSAKTELLQAFDKHPDFYLLSTWTPSTLVSGMQRKKKQPDPSLLPKLNDKVLISKDFTSILSMRHEHRTEIIAQLRECYDGSYSKTFGNGIEFSWRGRFGLVGACTPVYDNYYGVIAQMGERFLLFRVHTGNEEETGQMALRNIGRETEMRAEIREAFHRFIDQFSEGEPVTVRRDATLDEMLVSLACFCAYARCPVDRDPYEKTINYKPLAEGPARLVKQLMQMAISIAMVHGKHHVDAEVYEIVKKIGRDIVPRMRIDALHYLWKVRAIEPVGYWVTTGEIAAETEITGKTALRTLEDLMLAGTLNRTGVHAYEWQIKRKVADYIEHADIFTKTDETFGT